MGEFITGTIVAVMLGKTLGVAIILGILTSILLHGIYLVLVHMRDL